MPDPEPRQSLQITEDLGAATSSDSIDDLLLTMDWFPDDESRWHAVFLLIERIARRASANQPNNPVLQQRH